LTISATTIPFLPNEKKIAKQKTTKKPFGYRVKSGEENRLRPTQSTTKWPDRKFFPIKNAIAKQLFGRYYPILPNVLKITKHIQPDSIPDFEPFFWRGEIATFATITR
jgi:hypothetical protein